MSTLAIHGYRTDGQKPNCISITCRPEGRAHLIALTSRLGPLQGENSSGFVIASEAFGPGITCENYSAEPGLLTALAEGISLAPGVSARATFTDPADCQFHGSGADLHMALATVPGVRASVFPMLPDAWASELAQRLTGRN
jgi:hypothetical protein